MSENPKNNMRSDGKTPKMDFAAAGLPEDDVVVVDSCKGGEICGFDRVYDYGMRNTNCESAGRVLEMIRKLANTNTEGRQLDILVLTPFRNQAKIYSAKFRAMKVGDNITVRASTVHGAQGDEADVVFFDLVDPTNAFLTRKDAAHLWCVACSRAKEKLVLVGDKAKMAVSPFAAKLMNIKNG